ncbi:MAG: ThiF family adenylyltransferase [Desulfuromonadales bacterium]|nr:ThiF family adenylyltransferase [Desulfuromonadales bacterium]MDW7756160.1 ThiF family adenylyltransferase [Desulfuromonadales bacterium]
MRWWDEYPAVLDEELTALQESGLQPVKDDESFARGLAVVRIKLTIFGQGENGWIEYPQLYPYFRPVVNCLGLGGGLRHYNPHTGEICLLKRGTGEWQPCRTAAKHIVEMLPEWERAAVRGFDDSRLDTEDHQAEPQSAYFAPFKNQIFLMDSSWSLPEKVREGLLRIFSTHPIRKISPHKPLKAWVHSIQKSDKSVVGDCSVNPAIGAYATAKTNSVDTIRWSRIDKVPRLSSGVTFCESIRAINPVAYRVIDNEINKGRSGVHGFCFKEEAPGGGYRDGWLFLAYQTKMYKEGGKKKIEVATWVITTEAIGENDLFQRVPELRPLREKTVAVIGLGCVGAPSALEFARAGVAELRLWDGDYVSSGTVCRWPEGMSAITSGKVQFLSEKIRENYPLTRIGTDHYPDAGNDDFRIILGQVTPDYDQFEGLKRLLDGADLIYDATAELGINHLIADMAKKYSIPYVAVSSRPGGWGGSVVRILSGKGCFLCYLRALEEGKISQPTFDPEGDELQPVGCGDLTFKATSFDVQEISLAGVRMAISIMCDGSSGDYPAMDNDVGILHLRENGKAIFPKWESFELEKHPDCSNPWCGK